MKNFDLDLYINRIFLLEIINCLFYHLFKATWQKSLYTSLSTINLTFFKRQLLLVQLIFLLIIVTLASVDLFSTVSSILALSFLQRIHSFWHTLTQDV